MKKSFFAVAMFLTLCTSCTNYNKRKEDERLKKAELERINADVARMRDSLKTILQEQEKRLAYNRKLNDDLTSFIGINFTESDFNYDPVGWAKRLDDVAKLVQEGENSGDAVIQNLAKRGKEKLIATQRRYYPVIRSTFAKELGKAVWDDNGYISVSGTGNKTINLTHSSFASNRNIREVQEKYSQTFRLLRFTRSQYRWYRGQSEYTYYTMPSKTDVDLAY